MFRHLGLSLLACSALMAAPAMPAFAQYYRPAPQPYYRAAPAQGAYRDDRLPAPGYVVDEDDDDAPLMPARRAQYSQNPQVGVPSSILPDEAPPQSGHQLDAQPLPPAVAEPEMRPPGSVGNSAPAAATPAAPGASAALPPEDQPETGPAKELPPNLQKQLVDYVTNQPAGTIIVDTPNTYLYLVLGGGKAMRYGIGVGREGFTWAGTERVSRMKEWPDWFPPSEMIERQPYLPRFMAGGPGNPLGARALYLGNTLYRIHGTNQPSTIGTTVSSGCIRLINQDIEDLYSRVQTGTRVVVLPGHPPAQTADNGHSGQPVVDNPMAPPPKTSAAPAQASGVSAQSLPPAR